MSSPTPLHNSRRGFLKKLFLTAAGAAAGNLVSRPRRAAAAAFPMDGDDVVAPLGIGLQAADHVPGAIIVQADDYDYLIFDAWELDEAGDSIGFGTGVVQLTDCVAWHFRVDGDQHLASHPVDPSELDVCEVYEVHNSTWVQNLIDEDPVLDEPDAPELHHCIFTFSKTSFECVVPRYRATLSTHSFDELYAILVGD
jgi:hypothetical protein